MTQNARNSRYEFIRKLPRNKLVKAWAVDHKGGTCSTIFVLRTSEKVNLTNDCGWVFNRDKSWPKVLKVGHASSTLRLFDNALDAYFFAGQAKALHWGVSTPGWEEYDVRVFRVFQGPGTRRMTESGDYYYQEVYDTEEQARAVALAFIEKEAAKAKAELAAWRKAARKVQK